MKRRSTACWNKGVAWLERGWEGVPSQYKRRDSGNQTGQSYRRLTERCATTSAKNYNHLENRRR